MKRVGSDPIDANRTDQSEQAGNAPNVQPDPEIGERPALPPAPTVMAAGDRQAIEPLLSPIIWHPQERINQSSFGALPIQLTASQPVLREPPGAESARESGTWQREAPAALDKVYRRQLTVWVEFAAPGDEAAHREAERRIDAYLKAHEEERLLDLSKLALSTLPPMPADLIVLDADGNKLIALPENLPQSLRALFVGSNELAALPENLPQSLQVLDVSYNELAALPENLPPSLQVLDVGYNNLTALPEDLPQSLQELDVRWNELIALPENLPKSLRKFDVQSNKLIALPENLPQSLQELGVMDNELIALPENLPQNLQQLDVEKNKLTALPKNFPQSLKWICAFENGLSPATLLALMQANTSITALYFDRNGDDAGLAQQIDDEVLKNKKHPARLANAAVTLDLLTRLGFATCDTTGALIERSSIPDPVAGGLPQQSIPAELHGVLAARCSKDVLAVLAGMV